QPRILDITEVLHELSHLLRRLIGENIELKVVHGRDLGLAKVDQGQLEQVIINLAVNARDAMQGGGTLTIRTANITQASTVRHGHAGRGRGSGQDLRCPRLAQQGLQGARSEKRRSRARADPLGRGKDRPVDHRRRDAANGRPCLDPRGAGDPSGHEGDLHLRLYRGLVPPAPRQRQQHPFSAEAVQPEAARRQGQRGNQRRDRVNPRGSANREGMESPKFGSHKSAEQWQSQLQQRGWTPEHINEAIATGRRYSAPNYVNQGNTATRYVSPRTGQSVVVDDQTGEVLHVGAAGYRY